MAIAEDTNDAEYGHADDFSGTADTESKTIEVDIDHVEAVSERVRHASRPSFSVATTRDTALFDRGAVLSRG